MIRMSHEWDEETVTLSQRPRSFTLVELIIVVLLVGILAVVALPSVSGTLAHMKVRAAAKRLSADLNYVRNLAVTVGAEYGLAFTTTGYVVFKDSEEGSEEPGGANGREVLTHPINHKPWSVNVSEDGVTLSADFGGDSEMYFDATGAPDSGGTVVLQSAGLTITVAVEPSTGRVTAQEG
jgi:MSHA pilin protein MshC